MAKIGEETSSIVPISEYSKEFEMDTPELLQIKKKIASFNESSHSLSHKKSSNSQRLSLASKVQSKRSKHSKMSKISKFSHAESSSLSKKKFSVFSSRNSSKKSKLGSNISKLSQRRTIKRKNTVTNIINLFQPRFSTSNISTNSKNSLASK